MESQFCSTVRKTESTNVNTKRNCAVFQFLLRKFPFLFHVGTSYASFFSKLQKIEIYTSMKQNRWTQLNVLIYQAKLG